MKSQAAQRAWAEAEIEERKKTPVYVVYWLPGFGSADLMMATASRYQAVEFIKHEQFIDPYSSYALVKWERGKRGEEEEVFSGKNA
jgi:hypothetical protein